MCDVRAALGDWLFVNVHVETQGSKQPHEDETLALNARLECHIGKNPGWFALTHERCGSMFRFRDDDGKEDERIHNEGVQRCYQPRAERAYCYYYFMWLSDWCVTFTLAVILGVYRGARESRGG